MPPFCFARNRLDPRGSDNWLVLEGEYSTSRLSDLGSQFDSAIVMFTAKLRLFPDDTQYRGPLRALPIPGKPQRCRL